ncbi:MAG: PIG-L family deacetylase [Anaerolineales bacterium]|nr:MAG: PIG-L family deacetylase [Anaerolineales bacterium]
MTTSDRVLVVLAHPDDPEFFCGGTIARWAASGREITYCLLTRGDKGSDDDNLSTKELAEIREVEQRAAAKVLGVHEVMFLKELDGYVLPTLDLRRDIVRVIRQVKPKVVITCDPTNFFPSNYYINHADHRAAGQVTLDAVYPAARSALYFPELSQEEGLQPYKVREVYVAGAQHPNITVDITQFFNQKVAALSEHRSQIKDITALEERMRKRMLDPESPPDDPRYIERFRRIELR